MLYTEFVKKFAAENGYQYTQVKDLFDRAVDAVKEELSTGGNLTINGLFKLRAVNVAEHNARNPQTGDTIVVPPHTTLRAKFSKNLLEAVRDVPVRGSDWEDGDDE